ncbi:MAG: DHA2 family efflux MFS transporter permease subunit [Alphaproteobacteria bacterium]
MSNAQDVANRGPITVSIMLATIMNSLDTTIANVALPHIQGSVSASQDQITWVLTSYIISAAIMTPLSGWLSGRIGRKRLFLISIAGFTVASMLCGIANSLVEIVVYRLLQGLFGASLIPLSQVLLLDINPPEKHGQAMAIWGAGAILGPILGPALGGYLTDNFDWRWVFYINLPIGILAFLGVWFFISHDGEPMAKKFDFLGFGTLTVFIGSIQLLLDRGPTLDWFDATEIQIYAIIAASSLWAFITHTLTAKHPFFDPKLMTDTNFMTACLLGFFVGILLFATMALLPPMMQVLMGYPVLTSGLVSMPRGLGSFCAMFVVGQLIGRVDTRLILLTGLSLSAIALWQMTQFDLSMNSTPFIVSGIIQGFGIGLIFVPLSTLAFATVPPHLRAEGSSVYTLIRNLGAAVGISIMQALIVSNTQAMHESLAADIIPSDPVVHATLGSQFDLSSIIGLATINGEITRQSTMVAYVDDFRLMLVVTIICAPMLLLMRKPKKTTTGAPHVEID